MRTVALISSEDCSIDHLCWPDFDSPSVFIRLLDKDKGGHFMVSPANDTASKQSYSGNILVTKFLSEPHVSHITDFMPLPDPKTHTPFYPWLVRRLECVRGEVVFNVECFPAFNYALCKHTTRILEDEKGRRVLFESPGCGLSFELLWTIDTIDEAPPPKIEFRMPIVGSVGADHADVVGGEDRGLLGPGAVALIILSEGQTVSLIFRILSFA